MTIEAALPASAGVRRRVGAVPSTALVAGWCMAVAAYAAAAVWVAAHPAAISSDDALFLAHGLARFSVLDFSPQFPGYPGFIAMGRLLLPLAGDPLHALVLLGGTIAFAIPPLAGVVAWRSDGGAGAALAAFVLALCQPLTADLALSLLTDGAGILFLLAFLALLPRAGESLWLRAFLAGAALAWALACRPSDAILFAGAAIGAFAALPRIGGWLVAGGLAVLLPTGAIVAALEGGAYLDEAARFLAGHALLWGNTPLAGAGHGDWIAALGTLPGGLPLMALTVGVAVLAATQVRRASPVLAAATVAFFGYGVWVAAFQNPDQLRHLAPLLVLGGVILAMLIPRFGRAAMAAIAVMLALDAWTLAATVDPPSASPPLTEAGALLAAESPGTALATNSGVAVLRDALPDVRVYDAWYLADARLGLAIATGPAFRLTTTPLPGRAAAAVFPGRFAGEPTLRLYRER